MTQPKFDVSLSDFYRDAPNFIEWSPTPDGLDGALKIGQSALEHCNKKVTAIEENIKGKISIEKNMEERESVKKLILAAEEDRKKTDVEKRKGINKTLRELKEKLNSIQDVIEHFDELESVKKRLADIEKRIEIVKKVKSHPESGPKASDGAASSVAPSQVNSLENNRKYFRILVWNLENFTRDQRPRGSASMDSARNMARKAAVSYVAWKMGADCVLMMETGSDVGAATTQIAKDMQGYQDSADPASSLSYEPLTTPLTHAAPSISSTFEHTLKHGHTEEESCDRILALGALLQTFKIAPATPLASKVVTAEQILDACVLLVKACPVLRDYEGILPLEKTSDETGFGIHKGYLKKMREGLFCPNSVWINLLRDTLAEIGDGNDEIDEELETISRGFTNITVRKEQRDSFCLLPHCISAAKRCLALLGESTLPSPLAYGIELALLYILLAHEVDRKKEDEEENQDFARLWESQDRDNPRWPLLAMYYVTFGKIRFVARVEENGQAILLGDQDITLHALSRIGFLKLKGETYGVIYRPRDRENFYNWLDYDESIRSECRAYKILKRDQDGNFLALQQHGSELNGRSALSIELPLAKGLKVPLLLLHNRYSANDKIRVMKNDVGDVVLSEADKPVRARILTLLELTKSVPMDPDSIPLIIGDFNIPGHVIDAESKNMMSEASSSSGAKNKKNGKKPSAPESRNCFMHRELYDGMLKYGYVRRVKPEEQTRTTLLQPATIARDGRFFSEPYDAVYQPFDFMGGEVSVSSGTVIDIRRIFHKELMNKELPASGKLEQPSPVDSATVVVEERKHDDESELDDRDANEERRGADIDRATGQEASSGVHRPEEDYKKFFFKTVLSSSIGRVYRAQAAGIIKRLESYTEFFKKKLGNEENNGISKLLQYGELEKLLEDRAKLLEDAISVDPYARVELPDEPFKEWKESANEAVAFLAKNATEKMANLPAAFDDLSKSLKNIELNTKNIRLWLGYYSVVSDHLPIIIEIKYQ